MKNSITYLLVFFFLIPKAQSQQIQLSLANSGSCVFYGNIYAYGLSTQKQRVLFKVYRLNKKLVIQDSFSVSLSKANPANYLGLSCDTLHSYLNIYLQEKEKKLVTVFRFNKTFVPLATIEQVDVARLNNTSLFGSEALYYKNCVYNVRMQPDTSGKQFYLDKYTLKSEQKNFDYELSWQFPFERKNIRSAHIFFADKKQVMLFVHVSSGIKTGQWVLSIHAENGKLIRGTKINAKGESGTYLFGAASADSSAKSLQLMGEKYSDAQLNQNTNTLNILNRSFASVYLFELDSSGEVSTRQEFKVPITSTVSGTKKTSSAYLLRITDFKKNSSGIEFETDVYGSSSASTCYRYMNTTVFRLLANDDKLLLEKNTIASNPLIEKFYFTADKLDMNGKLCADSISQFETVFYKPVVFPVRQAFKSDEAGNPSWLFAKSNTKKGSIAYSLLQPVNKIYGLIPLDEVLKSANPQLLPLSDAFFAIARQTEEQSYQLKLFTW